MISHFINEPDHWRARAEEARNLAAYFVWWSLQVLDRLTPEYDGATAGRLADIIVSAKDSWSRMLPLPLGIRPAGQEQAQALVHDACLKAHNSEIAKVNAAI